MMLLAAHTSTLVGRWCSRKRITIWYLLQVGCQENGSYVLNGEVEVDKFGRLVTPSQKKYIWADPLPTHGSVMPMAAAVATPFDDAAGRRYFKACREMVPKETYFNMVLQGKWP